MSRARSARGSTSSHEAPSPIDTNKVRSGANTSEPGPWPYQSLGTQSGLPRLAVQPGLGSEPRITTSEAIDAVFPVTVNRLSLRLLMPESSLPVGS